MSKTITKKNYNDYSRSAAIHNDISRKIADLQAHIQFLTRTGNVDALDDLSMRLSTFLTEVTVSFINTLSDDE